MVAAQPHHALCRTDPDQHLFRSVDALSSGRAGQGLFAQTASPSGQARGDLLRPAALLLRDARSAGDRQAQVSAGRDHPAADGDVSLLGLAERLAASDPRAQRALCEYPHRAQTRHRGRRLDLGRIAVGQGEMHRETFRGGRTRHGMDLECDRQGGGRLEPVPRRQRIAARFSAQSPDHRRAARLRARRDRRVSNSDPITGQAAWYDVRVRIYKVGAGEAARTEPQFEPLKPYPGQPARRTIWNYFAGSKK
jgi:hypothetical protein